MMLVTLQQAKAHLAMDHDEDDMLITGYVQAASDAVCEYLKGASPWEPQRDSNGKPLVDSNGQQVPALDSNGKPATRGVVASATLIIVGELYKNREGKGDGEIDAQYGYGYLPRPAVALLYPLRQPTIA